MLCVSSPLLHLYCTETFVMSITAADEDEKGTLHSKIAYSIVEQRPANMFYIDRESGGIYVMHKTLDREVLTQTFIC